jgi:hypothetical protein
MNKHLLFLILFNLLFSCSSKNATNDLEEMNLKGNIKSVATFMFDAEEKFGVVEKGKPIILGFG